MKTMLMTKVKLAAALLLAVGVFGFGTSWVVQHAVQAQAPASPDRPSLKPPLEDPAAPPAVVESPKTPTTPFGGVTLRPPTPPDAAKTAPVTRGQVAQEPPTKPVPKDDALAARLAKIEERLARLEAEMARLSDKPMAPKAKDPYGRETPEPTPLPGPGDLKPAKPDPRRPENQSYGPTPGNPFNVPPKYSPAPEKVPADEYIPTVTTAHFKLPVAIDEKSRANIAGIALFASDDEGKTWKKVGSLGQDADAFDVRADHDGVYWFKVQVLHTDKRLFPEQIDNKTQPNVKVRVLTKPAKEDRESLLEDLELQLKAIQKRIAELKAKGPDLAPSPSKP